MSGTHTTSIDIPIELYKQAKGRVVFKEALEYGLNAMLGNLSERDKAMQLEQKRTQIQTKITTLKQQIQLIEDEAMQTFGMTLDEYLKTKKPKTQHQELLDKFLTQKWKPWQYEGKYNTVSQAGFDFTNPSDVAEVYEEFLKENGITNRLHQIEFCNEAEQRYRENPQLFEGLQ